MRPDRVSFLFLNVGHTYAHLFMLLYPTVVLTLEAEFQRPYGALLALATPGFVAFGAGARDGKSLINNRNTIPTRYSPALTISAGPSPTSSIIPPAKAGPMICPV